MESPTIAQVTGNYLQAYEALYKQVDPDNTNYISAAVAAAFLKKSGLSQSTLGKIWDLSDPQGKGYLDKRSLFVALKLIALVQNGIQPKLADLTKNIPPPKMTDSIDWSVSPSDSQKYRDLFNNLSPVDGKLSGPKVKPVLVASKLPVDVLTKIWDLSDTDQDGCLDLTEFILAMHLVAKSSANIPLPPILPPELINMKRKNSVENWSAFEATDPLSSNQPTCASPNIDVKNTFTKGPLMTWVVTAADKAKYDLLFQTLDKDFDGFVTGADVKNTLVQSGLPQNILAHIWNLCDVKENGKLNSEQFALAMYFIKQKQMGHELPLNLSAEMVPPTLRPKPSVGSVENALSIDPNSSLSQTNGKSNSFSIQTTGNKELDDLADELRELQDERQKLENELNSDEANVRLKESEIKSLQNEIETLHQMIKQLDCQKSEARKRLDDLAVQKSQLENNLHELNDTLKKERLEVDNLSQQLNEQKTKVESQESELLAKRKELEDLKSEESKLESQLEYYKKETETTAKSAGDTQLEISQIRTKLIELEEYERRVNDALNDFDSALSSQDLVKISSLLPRTITPPLIEAQIDTHQNGFTAFENDSFEPKSLDIKNGSDFTSDPFAGDDPFREDPFKFGDKDNDPFASTGFADFNVQEANKEPFDPFGTGSFTGATKADPFESDPFTSAINPQVRSESPTPALPPKKNKAPPPRPAPPKHSSKTPLRAAPAPPTHSSSGDVFKSDPFGTLQTPFEQSSDSKDAFGSSTGFANFANFDKTEIPPPVDPYATLASIRGQSPFASNKWNNSDDSHFGWNL